MSSRIAGRIGAGALLVGCLLLAGCESARFGGGGARIASARPAPSNIPPEPITPAVPSGSISSEPLPPPPGAPGPVGSGPVVADVPSMPSVPAEPPPPAAAPAAPSRSGAVGSYTARDATGQTCRVSLTSSPALDLYKASASGCANKDLARVTAWDFRDGEVYLYQPGGAVAARLRGSGGSLSGVLSHSGAPLTLTR